MGKTIRDSRYWDYRLAWASVIYFILDAANAGVKTVLPIPESMWGLVSLAVGVTIIGCYAANFKEMFRRSSRIFMKSVMLFAFIYIVSGLILTVGGYPLKLMLTGTALLTFAWWIPCGVYAISVRDKEVLYEVWVKASYIISLCCIPMFFFHAPSETSSVDYNMTFGYKIIIPMLIQMNDNLRKKRVWLLAFILFELLMMLIYSNRGPLLAVMFFVVYKFAFESNSVVRKVVSVVVLGGVAILMSMNSQTMAQLAVDTLGQFGYESRTLMLMASGMIEQTSGRDEIWRICGQMILEKPIFGWGLGGEYYKIGAELSNVPVDAVTAIAYNPHNGLVQNFVCFGIIGGLVANLIILLPLLNLKRYKDQNLHDLLLIFSASSVIPLCISASGFFIKPGVSVFLFLYYWGNLNRKSLQNKSV